MWRAQRIFYFATRKQLVAVLGSRVVGYAEASYTTPKEAGRIGSIYVNLEDSSLGIEKRLIDAARNEIAKGGSKENPHNSSYGEARTSRNSE